MMRNLEIALIVVMSFVVAVQVAWVIFFLSAVLVVVDEEVVCVCFLIVFVNM